MVILKGKNKGRSCREGGGTDENAPPHYCEKMGVISADESAHNEHVPQKTPSPLPPT